ncbi:DUF2711 family protein [Sutcliffiella sp. NC1]|uniref:DUF2711 family protein n=1 Tax=Sutcliffiella sp. NC1 TaxID=3004096 RepID=UPI0022DDCF0F|nr:DUF2711 family protein [Sutcliffiella sp. NC1]WBL13754.1 DUF2711 family protein [Sutcliffiella sp. NC1]
MDESNRRAPKPHKYAVCAYEGTSIKKFYKDVFEEVYIFFHPFLKPKSKDLQVNGFPTTKEIKQNYEVVTWREFLTLSGLTSIQQLDIGLRTNILGLSKEYADQEVGTIIKDVCQKHGLLEPSEGVFPNIVIENVLNAVKEVGHSWIWCGDEHCTERKLEYINDVIDGTVEIYLNRNLFTHDHKILITTHSDSHFSFVCSDKATVKRIVESTNLEGFYCTDKTEIYWSLQK